jgi:hypothetical protein
MANSTFYVQSCPICGRRLQIRVEYLGRRVACQHCQGQFTAADPANRSCDFPECGSELLRRADELLESVAQRRAATRVSHPR